MSKNSMKMVKAFLSNKAPLGDAEVARAYKEDIQELYTIINEILREKYELGVYGEVPIKVNLTNKSTHRHISCNVPRYVNSKDEAFSVMVDSLTAGREAIRHAEDVAKNFQREIMLEKILMDWKDETADLLEISKELKLYLGEAEVNQSINKQEALAIFQMSNICLEVRSMRGNFIKPLPKYDSATFWSPFGLTFDEVMETNGHNKHKLRAKVIRKGYAFWKENCQ